MNQIDLFGDPPPRESPRPEPSAPPLRALTVWRPWDQAIVRGTKRLENRSWLPPISVVGELIAIHAGKKYDHDGAQDMRKSGLFSPPHPTQSPSGCVVGVARVAGFVTSSSSPWFSGPYGWTLVDAQALAEPVPCRGAQGLWPVPPQVARAVFSQLESSDDRPTLHVTNFASRKLHGSGKIWSIMRKPIPARGHLGDGFIEPLMPSERDFADLQRDAIAPEVYRDRCRSRFVALAESGSLASDRLFAVPGSIYNASNSAQIQVRDGDTICCSCSRSMAADGWCHRVWVADQLAQWWRVILDDQELEMIRPRR